MSDVIRDASGALQLHGYAVGIVERLTKRTVERNECPDLAPLLRVAYAELLRRELKTVVKDAEREAGRTCGEVLGEHTTRTE